MQSLRNKAKARIKQWKKDRLKGYEIAAATNVNEADISRIFRGKGVVSPAAINRILSAKEPKQC